MLHLYVFVQLKWNPNTGILTKKGIIEYQARVLVEELSRNANISIQTILDRELRASCKHHYELEVNQRTKRSEK